MNTLQQRIINTRKAAGMTQSQLAAKAGLSQSTVAQIETGRNLGTKFAVELAQALGVTVDWLLTGMQSDRIITKAAQGAVLEALESDIAGEIRQGSYLNLYRPFFAESPPVEWDLVQLSVTKFGESFFKFHGTSRTDCRLIEVQGSDMEPYVFPGEWALIDTADVSVRNGEIYAFLLPNNECLIRRAHLLLTGAYSFRAYNPASPSIEVSASQLDNLEVLGRVFYRSGKQILEDGAS